MKPLAVVFALLTAAIGAVGVVSPALLLQLARPLLEPAALYIVAAVRIVFGVVLAVAASGSRLPRVLRLLGVILIIAGVLTSFFGAERSHAMFNWWSSQPPWFMRAWSVLAVAFGAFVIYALRAPNRAAA